MSQLYAKLHISPGYAVRKDFTDSERVAIGRAIEESLAGRVGRPSKEEIVQNFAHLKSEKSRDIAAQRAGFGNGETYRQAKNVVDHGVPELVKNTITQRCTFCCLITSNVTGDTVAVYPSSRGRTCIKKGLSSPPLV